MYECEAVFIVLTNHTNTHIYVNECGERISTWARVGKSWFVLAYIFPYVHEKNIYAVTNHDFETLAQVEMRSPHSIY
jgi:hypothetical protein